MKKIFTKEQIEHLVDSKTMKYLSLLDEDLLNKLIENFSNRLNNDSSDINQEKDQAVASRIIKDEVMKLIRDDLQQFGAVIFAYFQKYWNSNVSVDANLEKLIKFFNSVSFIPSIDYYFKLFKEIPSLVEELDKLFQRLSSPITLEKLENISSYSTISQVIDAYVSYRNIDIVSSLEDFEWEKMNSERDNSPKYFSKDATSAFISEIKNIPLLTPDEEKHYLELIAKGDKKARDKLIERNQRLVVSIARRKQGRGLELLDLIQEGSMGLIKAVDKFDRSREVKFSTYAVWWIKQYINRAIDNKGSTIRKSVNMQDNYRKLINVINELTHLLGREPKLQEVSERLGWSIQKIEDLINSNRDTLSINALIGDSESGTELEQLLPDKRDYYEVIEKKELPELINRAMILAGLNEKEKKVLLYRNGFYDDRIYTLEEVGEVLGLTKSRIGQIASRALQKMNAPGPLAVLADYAPCFISEVTPPKIERAAKIKEKLSIYSYFKQYLVSDIDSVLKRLDVSELNLLKKKFGDDFISGEDGAMSEDENEQFCQVLEPKIIKMLEEIIDAQKGVVLLSLFSYYPDYSKQAILEALKLLSSEEQIVVKEMFGDDYESGIPGRISQQQSSLFDDKIYKKILEILVAQKENVSPSGEDHSITSLPISKKISICDYYPGYTKEEISKALKVLNSNELDIVSAKVSNGESMQLTLEHQQQFYNDIDPKIRAVLYKIKRRRYACSGIYKYFNIDTDEQLEDILSRLTLPELEIVKKMFGDDYNSKCKGNLTEEETDLYVSSISPKIKALVTRKIN